MRLLLTADVHGHAGWYEWLLKKASSYEGMALAGDLIDLAEPMEEQVEHLHGWVVRMMGTGTSLILGSGNHDRVDEALIWNGTPSSQELADFVRQAQVEALWMTAFKAGGALVPGMTQSVPKLGGLIVTSLVFGEDQVDANRALLEEGASLRRNAPGSRWLVLNHQPPEGPLGRPGMADLRLVEWIDEYAPSFVLSGHDHTSPLRNRSCHQLLGLTRVFNAGHRPGEHPPCVELDLATGKYVWLK